MSDQLQKKNVSWSGRFNEPVSEIVNKYTASVFFDKRLAKFDIEASIAHVEMLESEKIISQEDSVTIINGLNLIKEEINKNLFQWKEELEDVHLNIEAKLIELVGEPGKMLHTGRSRNDQVATDVRLWLRDEVDKISFILNEIRDSLINLAEKHYRTIMPGYTHLQVAQPITFGHHLLAYTNMFERDSKRLRDLRVRINQLPLGSAALAGTSFKINREVVAEKLGFEGICENSLDAVSDRDFAIEFCSCASITMMHISRLSEEMILWMSDGFKFIDLPDRYCTGSSIMPQKKNPDVPELARGKTGRVFGNLVNLLTLMKSQPLAYNKDNQEDKEPLFDTVDTLNNTLKIFVSLISDMKVNKKMMLKALDEGFPTATDLADYLVRKKIPFREAHEIVSSVVSYAIENNLKLEKISIENFKKFSNVITDDVYKILSYDGSIKTRNHQGGTGFEEVFNSIKLSKKKLKMDIEVLNNYNEKIHS